MENNDSYVNLQAEKRFELLRRKKSLQLKPVLTILLIKFFSFTCVDGFIQQ